ncbi:MAG: hypothetical protein QW805_02335 [Candidatus Bathyarchaeia archaeon]
MLGSWETWLRLVGLIVSFMLWGIVLAPLWRGLGGGVVERTGQAV